MLSKKIILRIRISVSNFKDLKSLENAKLCTSPSEALWLIYVYVWEKVRLQILAICIFLMGQSFLQLLGPDPACYLITWRFLVAGAKVKAKTYQRTWCPTDTTVSWKVSAQCVFDSGKGRSRWVMMCPHGMVECWELKNLDHTEVSSYIQIMQHSVTQR